ncbi:hypothetical protein K437DRAFT_186550 [Tilletiaria anomala UBC 951]|uniref:RNI-like protein n=1 Tax=Tilletiaria anomala (strain ATCC 24038 / CBS 436.72 / UBC 951) TaxID=1037660 RepID=A0A066WNF7_TILAU|nr:uncharacterized protein K437DRAFT_186550 [Tilletiaria anomala UBC 951]KDN52534.1 hypothetical protein K437DRAFT_186550 [Tilletiaria anomala UBC 951]
MAFRMLNSVKRQADVRTPLTAMKSKASKRSGPSGGSSGSRPKASISGKAANSASEPSLGIQDLPKSLFNYLLATVIRAEPSTAVPLLLVSKQFAYATCQQLYSTLLVPDDEAELHRLLSEGGPNADTDNEESIPSAQRSCSALANAFTRADKYAEHVAGIIIRQALRQAELRTDSDLDFVPLSPASLSTLLSRFPNLQGFVWASRREPSPSLCEILSSVAPNLSILACRAHAADQAAPAARQNSISPSLPTLMHDFEYDGTTIHGLGLFGPAHEDLRFDPIATSVLGLDFVDTLEEDGEDDSQLARQTRALSISDFGGAECEDLSHSSSASVPLAGFMHGSPLLDFDPPARFECRQLYELHHLSTLALANLTLDGARILAGALSDLPLLESVTFDFKFVEDSLLKRLAECCGARKLKELRLKSSGTKVTDKGIVAVMHGCKRLQTLELCKVEGRLSKRLWSKIDWVHKVSPSFENLVVSFDESCAHHSWITDHLDSISEAVRVPQGLRKLVVSRELPAQFHITPNVFAQASSSEEERAHTNLFSAAPTKTGFAALPPVDAVTIPRLLPAQHLDLLWQHGATLRHLSLDFFLIDSDQLKLIFDSCRTLKELHAFLDAPFMTLLNLSPSLVPLTCLDTVSLTIKEEHCPRPLGPILSPP